MPYTKEQQREYYEKYYPLHKHVWIKANKKYRLSHKEQIKVRMKRYFSVAENRIWGNICRMNSRKRRKRVFMSKQEFLFWYHSQEKVCFYCEIPEEKLYLINQTVFSLDRLDNKKGYEIGNIVLSCLRCNTVRFSWLTPEEMKEIGQKYIKPKWNN